MESSPVRPRLDSQEVHTAPMVDVSNRFWLYMMRLITKEVILWNEMINQDAVLYARKGVERMVFRPDICDKVVFQLGGKDPDRMAEAAVLVEKAGWDEININCGCPSNKAGEGEFGAVLMKEPELVSEIATKMQAKVNVPVSVKCRLGVDDLDDYEYAYNFVKSISENSSVKRFYIHARKVYL